VRVEACARAALRVLHRDRRATVTFLIEAAPGRLQLRPLADAYSIEPLRPQLEPPRRCVVAVRRVLHQSEQRSQDNSRCRGRPPRIDRACASSCLHGSEPVGKLLFLTVASAALDRVDTTSRPCDGVEPPFHMLVLDRPGDFGANGRLSFPASSKISTAVSILPYQRPCSRLNRA